MHRELFAPSDHHTAWQVIQPLKMHFGRLRRLSPPDPDTVLGLIDEHTAIVDAPDAGDTSGGRARIRRHARRALDHGPQLRAQYPEYFSE
ncbi:FCD domain-containing protein (plasmid) [Embleya sp. NBC_00888]|nr:FCD domain-containing protein [Embleya sp. NBC_00888]